MPRAVKGVPSLDADGGDRLLGLGEDRDELDLQAVVGDALGRWRDQAVARHDR